MLSYRQISEILKVGIWQSPSSFMKEAQDWIAQTNFNVNQYGTTNSDISGNPDFYGYNPNSSKTIQEQYSYDEVTKFSDPRLLGDAVNSFADIVQKIDFGGNLEKSKLKFTSIPQGVFNFGLASKGLFRPIEYYSVEEKRIIEPEKVEDTTFKGLTHFFFYDESGNQSPIRIQQEGTFLIETNCPDVIVKYDNNARMFIPFKDNLPYTGCGKIDSATGKPARLRFTTTTKKVYMYREKQGGGLSPYVDLFVVIGGLSDMTTESMLVKNLPLMIISQFLNQAGIKTRILAKRAYTVYSNIIDYSFVIKDYGESLDLNQIAAFTSDKRFFRVNLWNLVPALLNKKENINVTGFGSTLYGRTSPTSSDDLIPTFNMSKNWALNTSQGAIQTSKVTDPRLMILGGVGNISGADRLNRARTIQKITDEIYRIGDYVSLMFSKNPRKTIGTIYDREMERQKNNTNKKEYIQDYLRTTILDNLVTIRESQVARPEFATPEKIREDIEEQSTDILRTLTEFINK
jgi:hypothetical protein